MRDTIRKNPGRINLLTIGPLTNAALLFALDPEIPRMLRSLVMMCGSFLPGVQKRAPREWNALVDPHATAIVYNSPVKKHLSIGYEVTLKVTMDKEEVLERFKHPLLEPVVDFAQYWFNHRPVITFHDPLAAAVIFDPGICKYRKGTVETELSDPELLGQTKWNSRRTPKRHEIAVKVDPKRFFNHYFKVFI
jgi:inosine-uridine nucleoside N-ribohydrolase